MIATVAQSVVTFLLHIAYRRTVLKANDKKRHFSFI